MPRTDLRELALYLTQCSSISLGNAYLARLAKASDLERDVRERLRDWVTAMASAELADLLRQHGEEIIATEAHARADNAIGEEHKWMYLHEDPRLDPAMFWMVMNLRKLRQKDGWTPQMLQNDRRLTGNGRFSPSHVKRLLRQLREDAKVIEVKGKRGDTDGLAYRVRLESEIPKRLNVVPAKSSEPKAAQPERTRATFKRSDEGWEYELGGRKFCTKSLPEEIVLRPPADASGSASLNVWLGTEIEVPGVASASATAAESETSQVDGAPLHHVEEPKLDGAPLHHVETEASGIVNADGAPVHHLPAMARTPIKVFEGKVWVTHPRAIAKPYSDRERQKHLRQYGGQPRGEVIVTYLQSKGYEAELICDPGWQGWPPQKEPLYAHHCAQCRAKFQAPRGISLCERCVEAANGKERRANA